MTDREAARISYDGPALSDGTMDVRELAPALLAVGALCERANAILNGDRATLHVRVRSEFEHGCFEVQIELVQTVLEQVKGFFTGDGIKATNEILGFIGLAGVSGVGMTIWKVIRWLKGRSPEKGTELADGTIRIEIGADSVTVPREVAVLVRDPSVRRHVSAVLQPLRSEGIDKFETREGRQVVERVTKEELELFAYSPPADEAEYETVGERVWEIVKPSFRQNLKWEFVELDGAKITATMEDPDIIAQVDRRERSFFKGDLVRAVVRTRYSRTKTAWSADHRIERVLEILLPPKQHSLIKDE